MKYKQYIRRINSNHFYILMSISTGHECHALCIFRLGLHNAEIQIWHTAHRNKIQKYSISIHMDIFKFKFIWCDLVCSRQHEFPSRCKIAIIILELRTQHWNKTVNTHTGPKGYHYDDATWTSCSLNSQSFDCLFNSLCGSTSKYHQSPRYWPFVRGVHRWPGNWPYH